MGEITTTSGGKLISKRAYFATMGALMLLGFGFVALTYWITTSTSMFDKLLENETGFGTILALILAPIVGIIVTLVGKKKRSLGLSVVGYILVVGCLGFTTGILLPLYDLSSIFGALVATLVVAAVFTVLGMLFPELFAKLNGVLFGVLIGAVLGALICTFMRLPMVWYNWVILVVFAGFIGHDTYKAANDEPTVANAVWHAVDIWVDLINIFLQLLDIFND